MGKSLMGNYSVYFGVMCREDWEYLIVEYDTPQEAFDADCIAVFILFEDAVGFIELQEQNH